MTLDRHLNAYFTTYEMEKDKKFFYHQVEARGAEKQNMQHICGRLVVLNQRNLFIPTLN